MEREDMDEQAFQKKFAELLDKIQALPSEKRGKLEKLAEETQHRRDEIQKSVGQLQESLDYLRLCIKYLVFDLEATRRENQYLRRLVEQMNRDANASDRDQANDDFMEGEEF
jgi:septal ring factor EnvC (AmiA/AmiB activator)